MNYMERLWMCGVGGTWGAVFVMLVFGMEANYAFPALVTSLAAFAIGFQWHKD